MRFHGNRSVRTIVICRPRTVGLFKHLSRVSLQQHDVTVACMVKHFLKKRGVCRKFVTSKEKSEAISMKSDSS